MELAVDSMHHALLANFYRWRLHTSQGGDRKNKFTGESDALRTDAWTRGSAAEQMEEVALFLLIWGEGGNLRFMPELLCFLFEVALAHTRRRSMASAATGGPSPAERAPEAEAATAPEGRATAAAASIRPRGRAGAGVKVEG